MDDENNPAQDFGDQGMPEWNGFGYSAPSRAGGKGQLTIALLEDLAAVLMQHGYPPLCGYGLAELTASLYRLAHTHD